MIYFIILCTMAMVIEGKETLLHRSSVGVSFKLIPKHFIATSGSMSITFNVQIPPPVKYSPITISNSCVNIDHKIFTDVCNESIKYLIDAYDLTHQIENEITLIQTDTDNILKQIRLNDNSMQKRSGIIPISSVLRNIFGIASDDQIQILQDDLELIQKVQIKSASDRQSLYRTISNLANNTNQRINHLYHSVNHTNTALLTTINKIENLNDKLDKVYQVVLGSRGLPLMHVMHLQHQLLSHRIESQEKVLQDLRNFRNAISKLLSGKLSEHLIPFSALKSALDKASNKASTSLLKNKPLAATMYLPLYYKMNNIQTIAQNDSLLVTMPVPMTHQQANYKIYQVKTYGIAIHSSTPNTQTGYTKLINSPDYLAVSNDRQYFKPLSHEEMLDCTQSSLTLCPHLSVTFNRHHRDCLWAIFLDDAEKIKQDCTFHTYLTENLPATVTKLDNGQYLFINMPSQVRMKCHSSSKFANIGNYSIISLPCNCQFELDFIYIDPDYTDCLDTITEPVVEHPISLPLSFGFDYTKYLKRPYTATTSKEIPRVHVPDMEGFQDLISKDLNIDKRLGFDTKQLAKFVNKYKKPEFHPLKSASVYKEFWTTPQIIVVTALSFWNLCITIALIYIAYKTNLITFLVVNTSRATAFTIPYSTPHTNLESNDEIWQLTLNKLLTATCILVFAYAAIKTTSSIIQGSNKLYKYFRICFRPNFPGQRISLFTRIVSGDKVILLFLKDIPFHPDVNSFSKCPKLNNITLFWNFFIPKIKLEWSGPLEIVASNTKIECNLPSLISTTFLEYFKLKSILENSTNVIDYTLLYECSVTEFKNLDECTESLLHSTTYISTPSLGSDSQLVPNES